MPDMIDLGANATVSRLTTQGQAIAETANRPISQGQATGAAPHRTAPGGRGR